MFVKLYLLSLSYYSNSCKTEYYIVYLQWVVSYLVADKRVHVDVFLLWVTPLIFMSF